MREPARLTGELLARRGQALPITGLAHGGLGFDPLAALRPSAGGDRRVAGGERREGAGRRAGDRVALTVRLDRERHRRLRIFAARHDRSSQDVIVRALDAYLASCGEDCACLRGETEDCVRN